MDTISKLKKLSTSAILVANKYDKMIEDIEKIEKAITDLSYLKINAGYMAFIGKSGKKGETNIIGEISINLLAGCVEVPALLIELAKKRLDKIKSAANDLVEQVEN